MKRNVYIFLLTLLVSAQVAIAQKTKKPNIIFILADDLGWSDVAGRSDFYETPRIDALLQKGLTFNFAYSNGVNCAPTRAAYLSGRYGAKTGIVAVSSTTRGLGKNRAVIPPNSSGSLPENVYSVAKAMKASGYYTGIVGKWHVGYYGNSHPENQGYDTHFITYKPTHNGYKKGHIKFGPASKDYKPMSTLPYYEEEDAHVGNILAREALHFLENAAKQEKPFFLDYHQFLPHGPLQAPDTFIEPYKNKPAKKGVTHDNKPSYAGQIACLDYNVGRILDKVKALGIADNTIIVFASDNGGVGDASAAGFLNMDVHTSNLPLKGRKNHAYEGGIRTPFSIYWPGVTKENTSTDQQLMLFDLYPTFVDIAGGKLDQNGNILKPDNSVYEIDGKSLKPVITGKSKKIADRDLYWIYPSYVGALNKMANTAPYYLSVPHGAVRSGDYKMVYNWEYDSAELYNIKEDFEELHNIAAKHPELVTSMKTKLIQHAGKFAPVRKADTQWPFVSSELANNVGSTNIYIEDMNPKSRKVLGRKKDTGVYITHINKENFVTKSKSINAAYNYMLTKIEGVEIKNVAHAKELLKDKKMGEEIAAVFWKAGKEKPCVLKIEKSVKISQNIDKDFFIDLSDEKWTISKYLLGMHSVYSSEPDDFYSEARYDLKDGVGTYAEWMKQTGISTMRYPGGSIVKYWDWETPNGVRNEDIWSPDWNSENQVDASEWTGLDEYIQVVKDSDITPMFGVNITSCASPQGYMTKFESMKRAKRMVNYVKQQGLGGAFWYLGNEGMNGGWEEEAALVKFHAYHMKQVDPDIKIMFNHNNLSTSYLRQYLDEAKKKEHTGETEDIQYIDMAETHGKWPYGGSPDINQYPAATFSEWQTEYPLRDRKNRQREWRNELVSLRAEAAAAGNPNLLFANNEYGHGKGSRALNFDKYSKNLLVIDMLQEHFIGNWDMTCYWSQIKTTQSEDTSVATNRNFNYQLNAMHFGFEFLAEALEGKMIKLEDPVIDAEVAALTAGNYAANSVYGFVAKKENKYLVYVLNKSSDTKKIQLNFNNTDGLNLKLSKAEAMVNTVDELGEVIALTSTEIAMNKHTVSLPSLSYTKLTYLDENDLSVEHSNTASWEVSVHPNPSKKQIFVASNFPIETYSLYNMQGQLLKTNPFPNDKRILMEHLERGTYVLKIQNKASQQKIFRIFKD